MFKGAGKVSSVSYQSSGAPYLELASQTKVKVEVELKRLEKDMAVMLRQ